MTQAEIVAALTFLIALAFGLSKVDEESWAFDQLRVLLIGSALFSVIVYAIGEGWSVRGTLFYAVLAIGGTEAGFWSARLIAKVTASPVPGRRGFKAAPWRNGIGITAGLALLGVLAQTWRDDEAGGVDTIDMPPGELPPL